MTVVEGETAVLKSFKCTFWSTQKLVHLQLNTRHKCANHSIIPDMMNIQNEKNQCDIYIWFARFPHRRRDIVINRIHCTDWMLTKFMVNSRKWKWKRQLLCISRKSSEIQILKHSVTDSNVRSEKPWLIFEVASDFKQWVVNVKFEKNLLVSPIFCYI